MTVHRSKLFSSSFAFLLLVLATPGFAAVILSNSVDPPYQNSGTAFGDQTTIKAVGVEIPAGPDYLFESFRVALQGIAPDSVATGHVFSDDGANSPQAELQTLNTSLVSFGHDIYDFDSPVPLTLEAGEKYWFAISDSSISGAFRWDRTEQAEAPSGIANFLGYSFSQDSGATWGASSFFNALELRATLVPEPAACILGTSMFFFLLMNRSSRMGQSASYVLQ